jgi:hypothetical protein
LYLSDKDLQKHIKLRHNSSNENTAASPNDVLSTEKSTTRKEDANGEVQSATTSSQVVASATTATTIIPAVESTASVVGTAAEAMATPQNHIYDNLSKIVNQLQQQTTCA